MGACATSWSGTTSPVPRLSSWMPTFSPSLLRPGARGSRDQSSRLAARPGRQSGVICSGQTEPDHSLEIPSVAGQKSQVEGQRRGGDQGIRKSKAMYATEPPGPFRDSRIRRMLDERFEEPDHARLVRGMAGEQLSAAHD